jgi:CRP-like cAMP-binding protein
MDSVPQRFEERLPMTAVDRSLVANLPMFAGLTPAEQDELLREARSIRYQKGAAVFEQGAEANRFFVLLHGHLRVEKNHAAGAADRRALRVIRRIVRRRASHEPGALSGHCHRCRR